ncbi:PepSY-associated TM helix domain-containing protein [Pseudomonas sp. BN102]|uniref:PepSY-associated TM helix domain-containing protein n=1 Tax=Pseudomonas sp. BN102 TaxID=2567886 RepID=UPI002453B75D|nr:PepSY-associated TM helix domain-containing protein [Pseudomonas sp. BN102]MDH4609582.1 PepSY domain-containing protein [Pseudomonas sp. BN102]
MSLRQSMAGLHTWGGLLPSWLLFVIFFAGSIACFDKELERWMRPALHEPSSHSLTLDQVREAMLAKAPDAHAIWIRPPSEREPFYWAGYEPADESEFVRFALDPATGEPMPETVGGLFFFTLHYDLNAGMIGMYIVAIAAMFMLVALVSGIIIHRRIFKDFFTLRPDANGQRAWLDAHNLFGVVGLPFHLVIAYTGLAIFVTFYMPAGIQLAYKGDAEAFFNDTMGAYHREEVKQPAPTAASLDSLLADAHRRWGGSETGWISVHHPGDAAAVVDIRRYDRTGIVDFQWTMSYDAASGELLHEQKPYSPGYNSYAWLTNLHMAQFGGQIVRALYLLLGLMGCAMLVAGLQVWLRKREARSSRGIGLVRALNGAVIGGLPVASLGLLYGNRLLPASMAERASAETWTFVGVWLLVAVWAILRRNSGKVARDVLATVAVLALGLPVLNVLVTSEGSLLATLGRGDWDMAGIDLVLLASGALCGLLAWRRSQPQVERAVRVRHRLVEESA